MRTIVAFMMAVLHFTLTAQISITSMDMPEKGDTFRMSMTDTLVNFSPQQTGPHQFWDYSNIQLDAQSVDSFVGVMETHPGFAMAANAESSPKQRRSQSVRNE
jgi:hypothetical protein